MSHSLKMLPCKKRRAIAVEPQNPSVDSSYHKEGAALLSNTELVKPVSSYPSGIDQLRDCVSKHCRVSKSTDAQPVSTADKPGAQPACSSASTDVIQDEDLPFLEATDGGASRGNLTPGKETSQACSQRSWREPVETFLRSGKTITVKPRSDLGHDSDEGHQNTKESVSSTEFLDQDKDKKFTKEGKSPKLHTEVEVDLQRDPYPANNHSPKQLAQESSSLQLPIKVPAMIKSLKNTKAGEQLQQTNEETEDIGLFIPLEEQDGEERERRKRRRKATKRKREERGPEEESLTCDIKLDDMLDRTLEDGAKQHNLTVVNVRNILHEVITNEHVVAMMKAAISETADVPIFEPKMTRSKLKEVVEKGVVIPAWNISPIKKANEIKPPQFVDIPLEEDDSSDEEYQPEDEDEDETAEESLLESDVESTASSPRGAKRSRTRRLSDMIETDEEGVTLSEVEKVGTPLIRHISAEVVPMGPPPPPKPKQSKDSTFMEKLHAVDEELASSPVCMDSYQSLEDSLIAFRTRSKRPLKDVPLGQLEAELCAPDITPDMYDPNTADDEDWKRWLGGLMNDDVENEDEADDDDDPEYNFLEDLDEPDTEDFRNDRAVRITKKEVNELMEELFETVRFQDEMGFSNMEDEGPEDEDNIAESRPNFNTPQALRFEEPLANLLNEQHRTVKEQLEQLRIKKSSTKQPQEMERSKPQIEKPLQTLVLDMGQRKRLHQQMQQHVQLLTQIHLLTCPNPSLTSEASTTRMFLTELSNFAHSSMLLHQQFHPKFPTVFQPCNLKGALQLIEDFHAQVKVDWSPRKTVKKSANEFPCLPKQVAWILATRKVFMYPELLPICSLKAKAPQNKIIFTKAEDNLLALGLKHFEGTEFPKPLISKYLLTAKTANQLTVRIKNLNMNRAPDNIIRYYKRTKQLPVLFKCCEEIQPTEWKPPVEREEQRLPFWLKASLSSIQRELKQLAEDAGEAAGSPSTESVLLRTGKETSEAQCDEKYPLLMPKGIVLTLKPLANRFSRRAWRRQRSAALKPLLIRPSPCLQQSSNTINIQKAAVKLPQSEAPPSKVVVQIPQLIQPATIMQTGPGMQHLNIPSAVGNGDRFEFQSVLSTLQSDSRTSLPAAVSPALISSDPVTIQTKMMLPALAASKSRKPCVRKGYQKKKGTKPTPLIKAAPLIHPAPVIFTVPAATVKVVSIGNGCNMIQPINTTVGRGTQAIPITTLLVNPTTFPCPLNQPLVSSSVSPLIVSPNSVALSASSTVEDKEQLNPVTFCLAVNDENSYPIAEPKVEPQELYSSCSAISPKKEHTTGPATPDNDSQEKVKESECYSWIVVETVEEKALEPLPMDLLPHLEDLGETVKTEPEDPSDAPEETNPTQEKKNIMSAQIKEEFILDLGQELDMEAASEHLSEQKEIKKECTSHEEEGRDVKAPTHDEQELEDIGMAGAEMNSESSKNACHSTDVNAEFSSPLGKPEDSSSVDGQSVGTPAGPEAVGEKDGQEEEEEEDFDDFTQDEEDEEEMSSASEESVLSVPELQETMEKLTWLATERHLSQEGDSEEENSQEENSEPEEEEEEEGEGEGMENLQKEDEITDEITEDAGEEPKSAFTFTKVAPEMETNRMPPDENAKVPGKNRNSYRARNKRGRTRASKDTSKLLLLYDDEILERDPLREQKDLAFAQAYLKRVREALQNVPGKYEDFLRVIYEFETSTHKRTAVDLYSTLQNLLQEWPQLLTDFAAFLLPEQALECGLFEEQQAFDKSRKFLRQLEICFAENPTHHQKIIKVLQSCADCLPQEIAELKTQMWQLLKGHDHLQDEFSIFFDHLRPSASRMGDFEEINWTEEKEYEFDGFEEVLLPDVEEEEETPKMHTASKNKKRKETGGQNNDKEMEWVDGVKECSCSCHEGSSDPKLKKSKRRTCSHSSCKVCDSKTYKNKDSQELTNSLTQRELSPHPEGKELGTCKDPSEESLEYRDEVENGQTRTKTISRKADSLASGSRLEEKLIFCRSVSSEGASPNSRALEGSSTGSPLCSAKAGVTAVVNTAKESHAGITDPGWTPVQGVNLKLPQQIKSNPYALGSKTRLNQRHGGTGDGSLGLAKNVLGSHSATRTGCTRADRFSGRSLQQNIALQFNSVKLGHTPPKSGLREMGRLSFPLEGKPEVMKNWVGPIRKLRLKTLDKSSHLQVPNDHVQLEADGTSCTGVSLFGQESQSRLKSNKSDCCFQVQQQFEELECRAVPSTIGQREDEQQQKVMEATVCAKNSKVSSTGEKVVLWTREADRVILTTCQERGAHLETFSTISQELGNKTASEVSHRFRELMKLFHTSCDGSSEDEEDAASTSNTDQLSDKDLLLSEDEQDD